MFQINNTRTIVEQTVLKQTVSRIIIIDNIILKFFSGHSFDWAVFWKRNNTIYSSRLNPKLTLGGLCKYCIDVNSFSQGYGICLLPADC